MRSTCGLDTMVAVLVFGIQLPTKRDVMEIKEIYCRNRAHRTPGSDRVIASPRVLMPPFGCGVKEALWVVVTFCRKERIPYPRIRIFQRLGQDARVAHS